MKMKKINRIFIAILALIMILSVLSSCSGNNTGSTSPNAGNKDEVFTFRVSIHEAEAANNSAYLKYWGERIANESNGRIKFEYYWGGSLAGANEAYDSLNNGLIDIVWTNSAFNGGRWPQFEGLNLPLMGFKTPVQGAVIAWDLFNNNKAVHDELQQDNVRVLTMHLCNVLPLSTSGKKIETIDDLKGLRARCTSAPSTTFFNLLGGSAMSFANSETYENLSKNVCDGSFSDLAAFDAVNLYDVIKYQLYYDESVGFYFNIGLMFMNQNAYDKLPADLKALIDKYSGLDTSIEMAFRWYYADDAIKAKVADAGIEVSVANAALQAEFDKAAEETHKQWIEGINATGADGQAAYDMIIAARDRAAQYGDLAFLNQLGDEKGWKNDFYDYWNNR